MRRSTAGSTLGQRASLLRPRKKNLRGKCKDFFWDVEKKTCLTRTPLNWLSIFVYYLFFLVLVFLIFYICMKIAQILAAINNNRPQFILNDSPIGSSPGLNFFPQGKTSNLLWLSDDRSYSSYVKSINSEFEKYRALDRSFNTSNFGLCAEAPFGYDKKTPCIFLRINKIIMWKPKPYKSEDSLPRDLPENLKKKIANTSEEKIWVSCQGTTAKDRDHITEDFFEFQGSPGFDASVFPYDRQDNFLDPIVALMLNDSHPNKIIYSFKCSAWSKNLDHKVACVNIPYYIE